MLTKSSSISGFAVGFLQTSSIGAVSQYFAKRSSLAMGMAAAGGSVGQLVVPQILRFLLDYYGYFGCMLVYGALTWNSLAASALFRPLSFYADRRISRVSLHADGLWKDIDSERISECDDCTKITPDNQSSGAVDGLKGKETSEISELTDKEGDPDKISNNGIMNGELISLDVNFGSTTMLGLRRDGVPKVDDTADNLRHIKALLDPEFTRNPRFWLYAMAILLANPTVHNMVMFLPPYANEIRLSKTQASLLLSVGGFSDLVGKLSGGILNNLQLIRTRNLLGIVLSTLCIISMACISFPCYGSLMLMSVMLGTLGGIYTGINPICLMEITGTNKFPMAYTLAVAIHAISSLGTPMLAGKSCVWYHIIQER